MLLKKANTITTPTAYSNGFLHSVKPEVVENLLLYSNDFSQTDWVQVSTTRTGGQLGYDGSNDAWELVRSSGGTLILNQSQSLSGVYTFSCYVKINAISGFGIGFGGSNYGLFNISDASQTSVVLSNNLLNSSIQYVGNDFYRISITANGSFSEVRFILASADGTTTSILGGTHIVQDAQLNKGATAYPYLETTTEAKPSADFTFTRNSSATRVNELGYIEDVQIIGGELVSNGDFEEIGSELITNGSFSTDSDWTLIGDANISGGTGNFNALFDFISQLTVVALSVKQYRLQYEVVSTNSGTLRLAGGSSAFGTVILPNTLGVHTVYLTSNGTQRNLQFNSNGFFGSIDNVSVKEVGQDWDFGTGWTMGDGKAVVNGTNTFLEQASTIEQSTLYRVSFTLSDYVSGNCRIALGGYTIGDIYNANGTYTADVISNASSNTRIYFYGQNASNFAIDNISIKKITTDTNLPRINYEGFTYAESLGNNLVVNGTFDTDSNWTKGTGWSISGGVATHTGGTASYLSQSVLEADTQYRVKIKVVSADASNFVQIYMGSSPASVTITSVGEYVYTFISQSSVTLGLAVRGFGEVQIDNVSVQEVIGNLPVPYSGKGHLLLEGQRTNLSTKSEQIGNWAFPSNVTLTQDYGISPDGTINSARLQFTSNGFVNNALTLSSGTQYTLSVYAKRNDSGTQSFGFYVDGTPTVISINLTSDWQRFTYTYTASNSSSIGLAGNSGADVSVFGFQAEQGSYATSYIPTNGTAVTRLGETCNNATQTFPSEGVLYAEIAALVQSGSDRAISIYYDSFNTISLFYFATTNTIRALILNSGATQASIDFLADDVLDFNKVAIRYKNNNISLWANGSLIGTDTSCTIPTNLASLDFRYASSNFYGKTKMVATFPYLSNDEMECLTGQGYGTFEALAAAYSYTIK